MTNDQKSSGTETYRYSELSILHLERNDAAALLLRDVALSPSPFAQKVRDPRMTRVASLEAARDVLSKHSVDCLLLGSVDDVLSGLELCRIIGQEFPKVSIVMLTDEVELGFASDAIRHGAEDVLHKDRLSARRLWRTMLFAVERKRRRSVVIQSLKADCNVDAATAPMPAAPDTTYEDDRPRRLRLLVVDDCETNRRIYDAILQSQGFEYDIATSGLDAISKARRKPYDLVLMDFQMPGLDGVETAQCLRAYDCLGDDTRIIAATGHNPPNARDYYLQAGMDDYLAKPITPRSLLNIILRNVPASLLGSAV